MGQIIEIMFISILLFILWLNVVLMMKVKKLKNIPNESKLSGFEIAKQLSSKLATEEPHIIKKKGKNLDYYDSNRNVIKLSPEVFDGENIYAGIIATNIALESDKKKTNILKINNLNTFIVVSSYLFIILGACLNNYQVIHFGFSLFIISFIIQFFILYKTIKINKNICEQIEKEKVLKSLNEYKKNIYLLWIICFAKLPYFFINNFR